SMSSKDLLEAIRYCWIDCYNGSPEILVHDAGTNFTSPEFQKTATSLAITTKCVPVEAHWSIGLIEQAHGAVRRAFEIITQELPHLSEENRLMMSFGAVNNTAGIDGRVPSLLVYGAYPRMTFRDA